MSESTEVYTMERFWVVNHNADLDETGYPQNRTYIVTKWIGYPAQRCCELGILEDFCWHRFGPKVVYVQGVAAALNWNVSEIDLDEFKRAKPITWGGYKTKTRKLQLGIGKGDIVVELGAMNYKEEMKDE